MTFVDMGRALIQMKRPVKEMNMRAEAPFKLSVKFIYNPKQYLWRDGFLHRPNLVDGFLRAGFVILQQISYSAVALRVPGLFIPCVLGIHKIRIMLRVIHPLNLFKAAIRLGGILPAPGGSVAPVTVPINIFLCPFRVNMLTVPHIEAAVIVPGIIGAMLAGAPVVSCQFQIDIPPFQQLGVEKRSSGAAESAAVLRQIIPSRI